MFPQRGRRRWDVGALLQREKEVTLNCSGIQVVSFDCSLDRRLCVASFFAAQREFFAACQHSETILNKRLEQMSLHLMMMSDLLMSVALHFVRFHTFVQKQLALIAKGCVQVELSLRDRSALCLYLCDKASNLPQVSTRQTFETKTQPQHGKQQTET